MDTHARGENESMGIYWIIAILALIALLLLGVALYLRMGVVLEVPKKQAALTSRAPDTLSQAPPLQIRFARPRSGV